MNTRRSLRNLPLAGILVLLAIAGCGGDADATQGDTYAAASLPTLEGQADTAPEPRQGTALQQPGAASSGRAVHAQHAEPVTASVQDPAAENTPTAAFLRYREALKTAKSVGDMAPHVTVDWMDYMTAGGATDGAQMLAALRQMQSGEWEVLDEEIHDSAKLEQLVREKAGDQEVSESQLAAMLQSPMMAQFQGTATLKVRWTKPDGSQKQASQTMRLEDGAWRYTSPLANPIH